MYAALVLLIWAGSVSYRLVTGVPPGIAIFLVLHWQLSVFFQSFFLHIELERSLPGDAPLGSRSGTCDDRHAQALSL